ncbi:glycoside hydrolase family 32 protein [Laceyella putida]|uniref:Sucrose-6-phosphate hydrolase n=1 Tax=Laceyella putida TaxID=110101 RepID=A0ABW2RKA0_9BACL
MPKRAETSMTADKYRTILEAEEGELEALRQVAKDDPWKPSYHIHPSVGLLNDPNGLSYFNGYYHVFYQWYPFGPVHGMKHWAHVRSKDLIHWERMPVALVPTEVYETHGAFSGTAIEKDGQLYLYYTGNVKFDERNRTANQCLAIMDHRFQIRKHAHNPLISGTPVGYTGHVRDPKVFVKEDVYYMLLGAQRSDLTGALLVYESPDAIRWDFKGELRVEGWSAGYMWECPDCFRIGGSDVLLFSPQGVEREGHNYHNLYNAIYCVGELDLTRLSFKVDFCREIDKGFDFYAPQTFADPHGRRILLAWAGASEMEYPTDRNMWAHCLTIPRELKLEGNILKQRPIPELNQLRLNETRAEGGLANEEKEIENSEDAFELNVRFSEIAADRFGIRLCQSEREGFTLLFDKKQASVSVDRGRFEHGFGERVGTVRSETLMIENKLSVRVFVDKSVIEIFIQDGEVTFTSRVFPLAQSTGISLFAEGDLRFALQKYSLAKGMEC